jgi:two-component system, chemotaxis family, chemotaxis protein CheY
MEVMSVCRILCIEDDAETRILLKKSLEANGMVVDTVWGGEKGIQAAMNGLFDCVLLDLMMAELDGFQVLERLKSLAATSSLPVILVTARSDEESQERAKGAGADGYITKPFQIEHLVKTIRSAVGGRTVSR